MLKSKSLEYRAKLGKSLLILPLSFGVFGFIFLYVPIWTIVVEEGYFFFLFFPMSVVVGYEFFMFLYTIYLGFKKTVVISADDNGLLDLRYTRQRIPWSEVLYIEEGGGSEIYTSVILKLKDSYVLKKYNPTLFSLLRFRRDKLGLPTYGLDCDGKMLVHYFEQIEPMVNIL